MKKPIVLAAALSAAVSAAPAAFRAEPVAAPCGGEASFGIAADFTALAGKAHEHAFSPKSESAEYGAEFGLPGDGRRHQLSRLDWDMESVALIGLKGSARRSLFSLNAGAWIGAGGEGDMEDHDWFAGDFLPPTEYSRSDAELTGAWMFDANLSADLFRTDTLSANAFVGWRVQHWEWECDGRNDYRYSEYGYRWVHDQGHVCDYEQEIRFAYVGLGGTWAFADGFDLSAHVSWAPGYGGSGKDEHYAAQKTFDDDFGYDDGNVYAAGVEVAWHISGHATFSCGLDWQKATLHEGDTEFHDYGAGSHTSEKDACGAENEYVAGTFAFRYSF